MVTLFILAIDMVNFILFGNQKSGKSELLKRMLDFTTPFSPLYKPGNAIDQRTVLGDDGKTKLKIWDLSGDQPNRSVVRPMYYNLATEGIYCVDLSEPIDEKAIQEDITEFRQQNENTTLILVGTKADLCPENAEDKLASIRVDVKTRIVTSAKNSQGLGLLLERIHSISDECKGYSEDSTHINPSDEDDFTLIDTSSETEHSEEIDKLLEARNKLLPCSPLYTALEELAYKAHSLPQNKYQALGLEAEALVKALGNIDMTNKTQAIEDFHDNCHVILEGKHPNIMKTILTVTAIAIVTTVAALVGFGIGFAAGAWGGPLAFFTGVTAGCTAAVSVVAVSSSLGLAAGGLTAFGLFKDSSTVAAVDKVGDEASSYFQTPETSI